ncbi:hypothetical protein Scep_005156 [Stephania cephalantha]|uniref:Uncharacterized protein n=1 Tax=Stephania cephalantha TaxID=152367 RepID=A0AAP0KVH6_9MAGN
MLTSFQLASKAASSTNHMLPRQHQHITAQQTTNSPRSAAVDLSRDAHEHKLLEFRRSCETFTPPLACHVVRSFYTSTSLALLLANQTTPQTKRFDILSKLALRISVAVRVCGLLVEGVRRWQRLRDRSTFRKDYGLDLWLHNMTDEEELCSTQPIFNPEEDVSVNTLKNFEVNEVTQVEDYWRETSEECEVFEIELEIVIALNEGENEMKIDVISDKPEKPQIKSEEDQPLVLVQPPNLPCIFGTPYKGVEVKERSQIFYTIDTFVLDDPDATDSFVLEVPNDLLNLKEGVHASLPKYVNAPFVVDISKGEGITLSITPSDMLRLTFIGGLEHRVL